MNIRFRSSLIFAAVALVSTLVGCSSSEAAPEPTPPEKFSAALTTAYDKCGGESACATAMKADGAKLASILSPSVLDGATSCMQTMACGSAPLSCLGKALGSATPSAAQAAFATAYCESCSVVGGDACSEAFFGTADVPGLGFALLPFGDAPLAAVTESCTESSLGKAACQAAFTTCLSATATKFLVTSISAESAQCVLEGIRPPS